MVMQKQYLVTILGSESNRNGSQNRLTSSPMEKIDSSKELSNSHSKVTSELDIWSSILKQKNKDDASQLKNPPYIHPLVKNSKNYLSEKSLKICTESLGSETGSDGFSSYSFEDNNSKGVEKKKERVNMVKQPRCYPPPLPSLFSQSQPLQMKPHRDNGRLFLFLQVVQVPSHNYFVAKRQNGRLILTFATNDEKEIDEDFEEDESVIEKTRTLSSEITSIPNLELVVNKTIWLVNKRPKCSKFNQVSNFEDVKVVQHGSLPLINCYEYYWRNKATGNVAPLILNDQQNSISIRIRYSTNILIISNKVIVYRNMNIYQGSNEASQDLQHLFV